MLAGCIINGLDLVGLDLRDSEPERVNPPSNFGLLQLYCDIGQSVDFGDGQLECSDACGVDTFGVGLLAQLSITYIKHSSFNSDKILCK